ncbi:MAG TPA: ATP-binding protein [Ktedonobacteraceae bacterium]
MELIIFIGLQASGKSSFYQQQLATNYIHVSKDLLRNNRNRASRQQRLIEEALQAGRSAVVDNTNVTLADRAELIRQGRQHHATIIGYYFESQVSQCLERNRKRTGKARVPDVAIFATLKRLVRPSYQEGFDRLFHVHISEDGTFKISNWIEDNTHG